MTLGPNIFGINVEETVLKTNLLFNRMNKYKQKRTGNTWDIFLADIQSIDEKNATTKP